MGAQRTVTGRSWGHLGVGCFGAVVLFTLLLTLPPLHLCVCWARGPILVGEGTWETGRSQILSSPPTAPGSTASVVLAAAGQPWGSRGRQVPLHSGNSLLLCPSNQEAAMASVSHDFRANLMSSIFSMVSKWCLLAGSCPEKAWQAQSPCLGLAELHSAASDPLLPSLPADLIGHHITTSSVSHLLRNCKDTPIFTVTP